MTKEKIDDDKSSEDQWTVMLYMAGDNNLSGDCVRALMNIKDVDTGRRIHVIAEFDPNDPRISARRLGGT